MDSFVCSLVCFRSGVFAFILGLLVIWFGSCLFKQCWVWTLFHGVGQWVKSDIAWLLPQVLCYHCPSMFCKQGKIQVRSFVARLVFGSFFWQPVKFLPIPYRMYMKVPCRHSSMSPCSMSCVGVALSNRVLYPIIVLGTDWVDWGFYGTPLANNSTECNPAPLVEASFSDKLAT